MVYAMGKTYNVTCLECNFTKQFDLGVGVMYSSLEEVFDECVHFTIKKKLREILTKHDVSEKEFEHRLYRCEKCNALHERFWVRIKYDGDKVYEPEFRCTNCSNQITPVELPEGKVLELVIEESFSCPRCDKKALSVQVSEWD